MTQRRRLLLNLLLLGVIIAFASAVVIARTIPAANGAEQRAGQRAGLFVRLVALHPQLAVIRTVCPVDPPSTLFLVGTVSPDVGPVFLGGEAISCRGVQGKVQRVRLPLNQYLPRGTVVRHLTVTVSGDSGEVNGFRDAIRVG